MSTSPAPKPPKKVFQSASRNETFMTCSQLYAAKYIYRLPDPGNDGSKRGTVCHDTLELLLKPRHKHLYDAAIHAQTCQEVPALWRLIRLYARREGVADPVNLQTIDGFMMVALTNEFYGRNPIWLTDPKAVETGLGTIEAKAETPFEIEVNEPDGRRYKLRGFIDKTFVIRDEWGLILEVVDYKGSKARFNGEKATFNTQAIIYQLIARRLFPHIPRRRFRFLFLKYRKDPWQEELPMTDGELNGYEWVLTDMQRALEGFTLDQAQDHLAAHDVEKSWLCGKEGFKKDGTPAFICSARRPLDYWVIEDADGEIVASAFKREDLAAKMAKAKPGWRVTERSYPGCPLYQSSGGLR